MTYYYICDNCGSIADIAEAPHGDVLWACGDCDSEALWEFTDKDKAMLHARHIQEDQARADAEKRGAS